MFNLIKILYGTTNVPEPLHMASGVSKETTFQAGTAVAYDKNGALAPVTGDATAEYVVLETTKCSAATDKVPVALVTKNMLFETTVTAAPKAPGTRVTFSDDGTKVTATAVTTGFGAYVVDTYGATGAGARICVRLA
jgi:hypothetical protein